jgi:transcriptional regulator with XRE-family HTH domain
VTNEREVISVAKEQLDNRLGDTIKAARQDKGLTQAQLCVMLKITPRYLKYIENDGRKPSMELLERLVKELDIPLDKIFRDSHVHVDAENKLYILRGGKRPG